DGLGAHDVDPSRPFGVADAESDRASHRQAETDAGRDREIVLLELLPCAAAVTESAPGEVGANAVEPDRNPGGKPLEDGDEFGAVRLPRGQPSKHAAIL